MKKTFYSNGKLLITGEYVVLDGAKALALPTKFGQSLTVASAENKTIYWSSYDSDGSIWFESEITFEAIVSAEELPGQDAIKNTLINILHEAYVQNPSFIEKSNGYKITTILTFPKLWGLGTSSTLINNIAQWLQIDAFQLLKNGFGGSGYDIACAQNNAPIVYQLIDKIPIVHPIVFEPQFADKLFFVYLNKKQSSKSAITSYYKKRVTLEKTIALIDELTETIISTKEYKEFAAALKKHEIELSHILELETVQEKLFSDFDGTVKSLGAWGGDFVMAVSEENPTDYFRQKGYETVISYKDIIL